MTFKLSDLNYLKQELTDIRHDLHQHPELGFHETRTANIIAEQLKQAGLSVTTNIGGTGIVATLKQGNGGAVILLRADMDALPISEKSSHNYKSLNPNIMHACGHDGHSTMLLGAAKYLAKHGEFNGTVHFLFQPNEEHGLGALAMLNDNLLERFPSDEAYAIHNLPNAPLGEVSTCIGNICTSETLFEINIKSQGGHASMPQMGVDAILVGAELVTSLQTIIARKMPPASGGVVSVTEFISDGGRNILPGNATLKGDYRANTPKDRKQIAKFMQQICEGVAKTHNVGITLELKTEFIETINAKAPVDAVILAGNALGLSTIGNRQSMSFSEDFAHFAAAMPSCFILLGNGEAGIHAKPLHSDDYDFNDENLIIGAAFWTKLVQTRLPRM